MRLPKFEYLEPTNVKEITSLLKKNADAILVAGGTDILPKMKQRIVTPKFVINVTKIEDLKKIEFGEKKGLILGSLATLDNISKSKQVIEKFTALAQAAGRIASPQLRNMGTIGGNISIESMCMYFNQSHEWRKGRPHLCFKLGGDRCFVAKGSKECLALFQADTPPALIALGATVTIVGSTGKEKIINIEDFYTQKSKKVNILKPTDFVKQIHIPTPPKGTKSCYLKMAQRAAIDYPIAGAAACITISGNKCKNAGIAVTSVGSGPLRLKEVEDILIGNSITDELIAKAADAAYEKIRPMPHFNISAWYKRKLIRVLVKRSIKQACI
ncbi:MAG: xanthine dehydrogenase family protein subunit M [Desulfobacterium sp.]|nr:xanthine dehydrogenase family protein subunit M [Desulfobacterium sp.]MBU3947196.1 xanthine dehydrogenase family protein subunit M [Pseudomonadota bacterium]MBU4010924.1 xanthine dehydrogenase family protein subunit M [Pseudomonadota bacterium]MBU4035166.1 xanthine dehydrogenase family protein subunit M [Pseudomonadota bacterium]